MTDPPKNGSCSHEGTCRCRETLFNWRDLSLISIYWNIQEGISGHKAFTTLEIEEVKVGFLLGAPVVEVGDPIITEEKLPETTLTVDSGAQNPLNGPHLEADSDEGWWLA